LRERIADGFQVHHLDHNPGNNDPANLVLIEGEDHMHVHNLAGGTQFRGLVEMAREGMANPNRQKRKVRNPHKEAREKERADFNLGWKTYGLIVSKLATIETLEAEDKASGGPDRVHLAQIYAAQTRIPWPPRTINW
jgi:hypothetical protein